MAGIAAGAGSLGPRVGDDFVFRARVCRDACGEAFGACSALGKRKAQRCKRDMFERCRFNGPGVCRTDPIPGATPSSSGGVAKGAQLIAVQVFSISHSRRECRHMEEFPCEGAWEADELAALEHVYGLRNSFHIATVRTAASATTAPVMGESMMAPAGARNASSTNNVFAPPSSTVGPHFGCST